MVLYIYTKKTYVYIYMHIYFFRVVLRVWDNWGAMFHDLTDATIWEVWECKRLTLLELLMSGDEWTVAMEHHATCVS